MLEHSIFFVCRHAELNICREGREEEKEKDSESKEEKQDQH